LGGSHLGVELTVKLSLHLCPPTPVALCEGTQFNPKNICPARSRSSGIFVAYVLCPTQRSRATLFDDHPNLLTKDNAQRIAANIAKLPELLGKQ
jgi:hypothetical protein